MTDKRRFSYQPRGQAVPAPALPPYPTYGERVEMDGLSWIVVLFEPGMNMVEINTPGPWGTPRFFTVSDWKKMWNGETR